jgi:hypothetical protein
LGRGQTGWSRTDHRDLPPALRRRRLWVNAPVRKCLLDDRELDLLDRDRIGVEGEYAGRLTRSRTDPAGELGKVIGGVQALARVGLIAARAEFVPFRDQIAQGAAAVTERDAAVHTPARLLRD